MKIADSPTRLTIQLAPWEKLASLHGDVRIPLADVTAAEVDAEPLRSLRGKLKRGLRITGYRYLATVDRGRHFIAVRRGQPALHVTLRDGRPREVTVSTPDAERLAGRLSARAASRTTVA